MIRCRLHPENTRFHSMITPLHKHIADGDSRFLMWFALIFIMILKK